LSNNRCEFFFVHIRDSLTDTRRLNPEVDTDAVCEAREFFFSPPKLEEVLQQTHSEFAGMTRRFGCLAQFDVLHHLFDVEEFKHVGNHSSHEGGRVKSKVMMSLDFFDKSTLSLARIDVGKERVALG
jgi:hypothetical protein